MRREHIEARELEERRRRKRKLAVTAGVLFVVIILSGAGIWFGFKTVGDVTVSAVPQAQPDESADEYGGAVSSQEPAGQPEKAENTAETGKAETGKAESEKIEAGNTGTEKADAENVGTAGEERVKVRGIYVTGPKAGSASMEDLIALVDGTELNTMVIDVKNDEGNITYQMDLESAQNMGACISYISDMEELMSTLKEHNIYTIARIVCFKDPYLAENRPDLALRKPDGTAVTDAYGLAWVNPYKEGVWEYLTDVAQAAVEMGFDEVQFDYVRFPIGSDADAADYGVDVESCPKEQAITGFLQYASERLHEKGAVVTADVFGTIIGSETDVEKVGQNYVTLGSTVDVLSPMVYPSHYSNHVFGLDVPDAHPYEAVSGALQLSVEELSVVPERERAVVRPWLQAFTATWVTGHISYEGEEVREQIQAVYDAGYEEWILWNATNRYSADWLEAEQP